MEAALIPDGYDELGRLTADGLVGRLVGILGLTKDEVRTLVDNLETSKLGSAELQPEYFIDIFTKLQDLALNVSKVGEIAKGAYGAVYNYKDNATKASRVVKEQFRLIQNTNTVDFKAMQIRDFFIEIMIQTILSNDLEYGQYVPKIYKVWRSGTTKAYTEMERIDRSNLHSELSKMVHDAGEHGENSIKFTYLAPIIHYLALVLGGFNKKYAFVHLDFKLGNVGFKTDLAEGARYCQIFDFGSGCISLGGKNYRARAFIKADIRASPCNLAADFGLFMTNLYVYFGPYLDAKLRILIRDTLLVKGADGKSVESKIRTATGSAAPSRSQMQMAAYNYYGTLYTGEQALLPANIILKIIEINGMAGGRRRRKTVRRRRA